MRIRTIHVVLVCVTALLIAWLKYVLPVLERASDRDLQREILRSLHGAPSIEITPEPSPALQKI